ncbi:MAG: radical SAM protein, partial [Bacteroidota bacterium]
MLRQKFKSANIRLRPQKLFYGPEWLVLGVNNLCNLHCKMCDVGTKTNETNFATNLVGTRPLNMPPELIRDVLDQAAEYYPQVKIGYAFTEPLIYKHLDESLAYAKEKNLYTAITTNALTLKQKADMLVENELNDLFISLDGPQDIHNEIRGHKSSFQRAIAGMEMLFDHEGAPDISVYCVITEWNIGHLKEFADHFRNYPLKQLGFMHTNFIPEPIADAHNRVFGQQYPATHSNIEEVNIDNMDLALLWEDMQAIKAERYPFEVSFSPEVPSADALETFYHRPETLMGKRCNDAFSNIMIKSDGSVIPAHGRCYNLTVGSLYESTLKEVWNAG